MLKIAAAIVCAVTLLSLSARAGEATPPKESDRSAKVLQSLDRMREQLGKAREQIDHLEQEMEALRQELAGVSPSEELPPPSVPDAGVPSAPITERPPIAPPDPSSAGYSPEKLEAYEGKTTRTYPIRDPNFATAEGNYEQFRESDYLLIVPPEGDRVVAFDKTTRRSLPLILSNDKTVRHRVTPVAGTMIVGLSVVGPKISRLAVFTSKQPGLVPAWHPVELREPVERAEPEVNWPTAFYTLGRRVYAYSCTAERWDILELPKGVVPRLGNGGNDGPTIEHDGHIYTFVTATGKWADLDTQAILDRALDPKK